MKRCFLIALLFSNMAFCQSFNEFVFKFKFQGISIKTDTFKFNKIKNLYDTLNDNYISNFLVKEYDSLIYNYESSDEIGKIFSQKKRFKFYPIAIKQKSNSYSMLIYSKKNINPYENDNKLTLNLFNSKGVRVENIIIQNFILNLNENIINSKIDKDSLLTIYNYSLNKKNVIIDKKSKGLLAVDKNKPLSEIVIRKYFIDYNLTKLNLIKEYVQMGQYFPSEYISKKKMPDDPLNE